MVKHFAKSSRAAPQGAPVRQNVAYDFSSPRGSAQSRSDHAQATKARRDRREDHAVTVLRRLDLGREACRDLTLCAWPSYRIPYAHYGRITRRKVDRQGNELRDSDARAQSENPRVKPSTKGKWDVLVSSTMHLSVGDQIRVTEGPGKRKTS